jgi:hypothetical protein
MMTRPLFLVGAVASLAMGCASLATLARPEGHTRFESGIKALAEGDYAAAHQDLSWVAERFAHEDEGQRAVLVLAAMELDPRNPARRLDAGSDLAGTFLQLPDRDGWIDPLAQTLYLLGLELGAAEERAQRAERAVELQRQLPVLPGPSVTSRIRTVEQERDRLARQVTELEGRLAEMDRELQRIRKTIKP